jgi:hypothetical protein
VPGIDTAFRESPVRTFNPATGTFQYTNPTKLAPATGSGTSWVPPVITSRQRQLLNVGFRDDITTPTYDAVSNMLYQPAASSSQRFAADRSAQMRALQQLRTSVPMGSSTFLQLQSRLRGGEFGGVGGTPVDAAALEAAAKGYAPPTSKVATIGDKYFEKYPDVATAYANLDAATKAKFPSPSDYAQYHYETHGRTEGREMPTLFAHGGPVVKKQSGGDVSRETSTSKPIKKQDGGEATVEEFISQNMGGGERKQNIKLDSVQDLKDFLQKLPKDLPVKPVEPEEVMPDVALKRKGARELESYINALNPRAQVFDVPEGYQTNYRSTPFSQSGVVGSVPIREPDRINVLKTLTPGQRERVLLHEAEHSMSLRGGDILGEVDSKGRPILTDNAYRAVALLKGDGRPVREFVKNVALNKDKIDAFFGEPSFGTEFKKQSYEALKSQGKELSLFEEQLASLSALEQATGKFLTQDKEMRKLLFPNTEMMAIFDALTGPRQTRMDARDLPPHTPINPMAYDTDNAVSRFIKEKTRKPLLRELPEAKMRVK